MQTNETITVRIGRRVENWKVSVTLVPQLKHSFFNKSDHKNIKILMTNETSNALYMKIVFFYLPFYSLLLKNQIYFNTRNTHKNQKQNIFFAINNLTMQSLWLAFPATLLQRSTCERATTIPFTLASTG